MPTVYTLSEIGAGSTMGILHTKKITWLKISGGWTRSAKHDGAIDRFELSCNEPSYCADLEELKKIQLQELEITKMEVSPILVV